MKNVAFGTGLILLLLNGCNSGTPKKTNDSTTRKNETGKVIIPDTVVKETLNEDSIQFLIRLRAAVKKVNLLEKEYHKTHIRLTDTLSHMPHYYEWPIFDLISENDITKFSTLEYLVFTATKKESFLQACFMYFPPTYTQSIKSIYTSVSSGNYNRIDDKRMGRILQRKAYYISLLDSIIAYGANEDSIMLAESAELYEKLNPKSAVKALQKRLSKGGNGFFATAILQIISTLDADFFKHQPIGKYYYNSNGEYKYPQGTMDLVHIPYNAKNASLVIDCANKWLQKP